MVRMQSRHTIRLETQLDRIQQPDGRDEEARADSLFATGRLSEAALLYRSVLERAPGRLDSQARRERLALLQNNPRDAIDHLASVLNNGLR